MGYEYLGMDFLGILRAELAAFGELLADHVDLAAPVESCGDWTVYDLVDHVGRGNMWVATAVAEDRGDYVGEPAPKDPAELRAWYAETTAAILAALSGDPERPAWTFTRLAPRNVGFWRRRRSHETAMHRWDLRNALGLPAETPVFPVDLAVDGVTEVFELFAPRMVERGLAVEPAAALRVTATDAGRSWTYGPGAAVAELAGPAGDLLLAIWGRTAVLGGTGGADAPGAPGGTLTWSGDRVAGEAVLRGPLVP